jgi:ribosomal protein S18 acetylase RimI-like enzyme
MQISQASNNEELAAARTLFEEYAAWLGIDLEFQGFSAELATLPGPYALPRGRLLLGREGGRTAGCAALRPLENSACEMKRLFVRPQFRRRGVGRKLAEAILFEAREAGYACMRLDTLAHMNAAIGLYESLGFVRRDAYYNTPLPNTVFMELAL